MRLLSTTPLNTYEPAYMYSPYYGAPPYPIPAEMEYYDFNDSGSVDLDQYGPVEFTIYTNQFTFYMQSDSSVSGGHVVFFWECMDSERFPKNPPPGWKPPGYQSEPVVEGFVPETNTAAAEATMIVTEG